MCKIICGVSRISHNLRNCSSRCSVDKIQADSRQGGTQWERNQVKKSGIIERRKRYQRERKKKTERKSGVAAKHKKKRICRLAPFGQRFTPDPPFCFPFALRHPLRIFFLCCFLFKWVPAVGRRFRSKFAFLAFRHDKPHRDIFLSSKISPDYSQRLTNMIEERRGSLTMAIH